MCNVSSRKYSYQFLSILKQIRRLLIYSWIGLYSAGSCSGEYNLRGMWWSTFRQRQFLFALLYLAVWRLTLWLFLFVVHFLKLSIEFRVMEFDFSKHIPADKWSWSHVVEPGNGKQHYMPFTEYAMNPLSRVSPKLPGWSPWLANAMMQAVDH